MKQTAVGVGSQDSLIQVDHFQFLGCLMGGCWNSRAMTWVSDGLSRRPFGVDTLKEVQIIKPAEDGPYSPTQTHGLMQNATPVTVTNKLCS